LLSLAAIILGFLFSRNIVYTILGASRTAREIAEGNLSKRIEIVDESSEMSQLAGSFNEITAKLEQKIAELELSEQKFKHLVDNVPDLLYYLDPNGKITSVNEEVRELLGYSKEEFLGKPFSFFVHEEDYGQFEPILRERREDKSRLTRGLRIRLRRKNGEYQTFEINSRGIYDSSGEFVGTEGLARDISAQLALESEREEFLYMLTHDIKNPISAILFIIYMMRDGTISPNKFGEYYDKIEHACDGVVRLVEDFLEYKKFELGVVTLEPKRVNLQRFIVDIARTYQSEAAAKGKRITINGGDCEGYSSGEELVVEVDDCYLQRVIENLVTNAIKFADSWVDISCVETEKGARLVVRDNGPGVSKEEKDKIFNLFHTSAGTRTSKGIGVGLASVQKIINAHGGSLSVERENDSGCSFTIDLPKKPELESRVEQELQPEIV
jgi:two-component system sensor histidine kinase VicK